MSTPQPNAPTTPPAVPGPTTPLGAVQTMISLLSPPAGASHSAPPPQPTHASPVEVSPEAPVPVPAQPVPPLVPTLASLATQVVGDITMPPAASVSSHGGRASPPRAPAARVTRSYSGLPELLHHIPPPGPIPVPGAVPLRHSFRRPTAHYADTETVGQTTNDEKKSPYPQGSVGARLDPTVDEADIECKKAQTTAQRTEWLLNIAVLLQVILGALTTALGAALSGKNTSVAISTLGGASTVVASYLARMRTSNEPEASRSRAAALSHFLREIKGFQLDHGMETGHDWDHKITGFRLGLEQMLGNRPGTVAISNPSLNAGPDLDKRANPVPDLSQGFSGANNKFGFNPA